MAFDPDAFLAEPKSRSASFDPDAFLALPEPKKAPSLGQRATSFARGAKQGALLGFGPALAGVGGALSSLFTDEAMIDAYRGARDDEKAANDAAREADPTAYGVGEIGGGVATAFVPGLGMAKGAATLGKVVKAGAKVGGATALGNSDADLTRGDFRQAALDVALGAAAGAAGGTVAHGVGKAVGKVVDKVRQVGAGAAKRVAEKPATDLLERVPAREQDKALAKLGGRQGLADELRADKALDAARKKGPEALETEVSNQKNVIGPKIGKVFEKVDEAHAGVPIPKLKEAIGKMRDVAADEFDSPRVAAIDRQLAALDKLANGREVIKAKQLHKLAQRYGKAGFEGGDFNNPSDAKQFGRDMYGVVSDVLQEHVGYVAQAPFNRGLTSTAAELRALNSRYSKLSAIEDLAESRARREARNTPSLGQRFTELAKNVAGAGGMVGAVATGNVAPLAAPLAIAAAPSIGRAADRGIALMYQLLQGGGSKTEAMKTAARFGVPTATARKMLEAFDRKGTRAASTEEDGEAVAAR